MPPIVVEAGSARELRSGLRPRRSPIESEHAVLTPVHVVAVSRLEVTGVFGVNGDGRIRRWRDYYDSRLLEGRIVELMRAP
jgi:Limonene-1,2-epoxide hydrolase catalytic domain